jgi:hypothetical protein
MQTSGLTFNRFLSFRQSPLASFRASFHREKLAKIGEIISR